MASIGDLPNDLLLDTLVLLPMQELIRSCRLVCRRWQSLVDLPALWRRKYEQKGGHLETHRTSLKEWKEFYLFFHLERNLLKNPCGKEGMSFWEIKMPLGGQWKTKELSGADSLTYQAREVFRRNRCFKQDDIPYQEVKNCFVASDGLCIKSQLITLTDEGYWDELMDNAEPTITVSDWFYRGFGCRYRMCVKLLSADFKVIKEVCTRDIFERDAKTERWEQVSHTFDLTPDMGVRHILFQHQGLYANGKSSGDSGVMITQSCLTIGPYSID